MGLDRPFGIGARRRRHPRGDHRAAIAEPRKSAKNPEAVINGCDWLLGLQNHDGGFPTSCGDGARLPFDQSCSDLTGHALLALAMTLSNPEIRPDPGRMMQYRKAIRRGADYLLKNQTAEGALNPLWFGNQYTSGQKNPVYGTARVLSYLKDMARLPALPPEAVPLLSQIITKGANYLRRAQNPDGSWGGDAGTAGTVEETALALGAMAGEGDDDACTRALGWLRQQVGQQGFRPAPIGLYFASLWYDEALYPHTACLEGVGRYLNLTRTE